MNLVEIKDFGTIGGTHLSGEAVFSDGKRYRFIIQNGQVEKMQLPAADGTFKTTKGWRPPFPARALEIERAHGPYLQKALAEKREQDEQRAEEHRKFGEAAAAEDRMNKAAPAMLEALQAVIFDADMQEAEAEENGWSAVEVMRSSIEKARAAVAKALPAKK